MSVVVTRTTANGNVTYTIAITAVLETGDLLAAEASQAIYEGAQWIRDTYGNVAWNTLTNAQKMHILGLHTQRELRKIGYRHYYQEQQAIIGDITAHYGEE